MSIGYYNFKDTENKPVTEAVDYHSPRKPITMEMIQSEQSLDSSSLINDDRNLDSDEKQPDQAPNDSHLSSSKYNPLVAGESLDPNFKPHNTFLRPSSDDDDNQEAIRKARTKVGHLSVDELSNSERPEDTAG